MSEKRDMAWILKIIHLFQDKKDYHYERVMISFLKMKIDRESILIS